MSSVRLLSLLVLVIFLGAAVSPFAIADTIRLKNGRVHKGTITAEEDKRVQLKIAGSGVRIWFLRDQITSMERAEPEVEAVGPIYPLETIIVNLADTGGGRYLRVTMELELAAEEGAEEEVTKRLAQIKDAMLTILPTKQFDQLTTVEGKNSLRDEIIGELNTVLGKELVKKIFFTEFVIQ